jgi:hypothetical protein
VPPLAICDGAIGVISPCEEPDAVEPACAELGAPAGDSVALAPKLDGGCTKVSFLLSRNGNQPPKLCDRAASHDIPVTSIAPTIARAQIRMALTPPEKLFCANGSAWHQYQRRPNRKGPRNLSDFARRAQIGFYFALMAIAGFAVDSACWCCHCVVVTGRFT